MTNAEKLQYTLDRLEILDCIHRYCRAIDRLDRELLLSVYHEGATDDHGKWVSTPELFARRVFDPLRSAFSPTQHIVPNHVCEIEGDVAHAETYWSTTSRSREGGDLPLSGGRYIDRFEKREGRWAIMARLVVIDW